MQLIESYFPDLTAKQKSQFKTAIQTYIHWNDKINVISRKDILNLEERHFLHTLSISKFVQFANHTRFADIGTGGGFPGIPMAILLPHCTFTLIDSIEKKLHVASEVITACKLENVTVLRARAEAVDIRVDFVTGRAVENLGVFVQRVQHMIRPGHLSSLPNGILYLKGGDTPSENKIKGQVIEYNLSSVFKESFFETKMLVYINPFKRL